MWSATLQGWLDWQTTSICNTKAGQSADSALHTFLFAFKNCDTENRRKNAGDYWKQVKASRPLVDGSRRTSDGRADRCAVLGEQSQRFWGSPHYLRRLCEMKKLVTLYWRLFDGEDNEWNRTEIIWDYYMRHLEQECFKCVSTLKWKSRLRIFVQSAESRNDVTINLLSIFAIQNIRYQSADINNDGVVDITDATEIQKICAE